MIYRIWHLFLVLSLSPLLAASQPKDTLKSYCGGDLAYMKVNVHFIAKTDGSRNFSEFEDGMGSKAMNGFRFADELVIWANYGYWQPGVHCLQFNPQQLAMENPPPALPLPHRYLLTGVYFHKDDALNTFDWSNYRNLHQKYAVRPETEINIFMVNKKIEKGNLGVASAIGYRAKTNFVVLTNDWTLYRQRRYDAIDSTGEPESFPMWEVLGHLNHEVGHLLGLRHPWDPAEDCNDLADDNPKWVCSFEENSNNVMSYSCNQKAFSPCQVAKVAKSINEDYGPADYVECLPYHPAYPLFTLADTVQRGEPVILDASWRMIKDENAYTITIEETTEEPRTPLVLYKEEFKGKCGRVHLHRRFNFRKGVRYRVRLYMKDPRVDYASDFEQTIYIQPKTPWWQFWR